MLAEVFARHGGISVAAAQAFLDSCSEISELPGGALVRRGHVVHIVAGQHGIAGRALVEATRAALRQFHRSEATLVCPIRHDNARTLRYAKHFGFKPYDSTENHQWLYRHIGDAL